jgi:hypothetical protein
MKVKRLIIKNIGMIKDTTIELNKPLILFYGDLMMGKTTILNSVKFCFGGSYPSDIIRHGETGASVTLEFEGGSLNREWYKGKDGQTHAREIVFVNNGKIIKKPVKEIEKFLNPFLLDQDYLRKMTELERKQYFTTLFAVDTSEIDKEMNQIEIDARDLRAKIKGYGEIDLTEVKPIDVNPLKAQLNKVKGDYSVKIFDIDAQNRIVIEHNSQVLNAEADIEEWDKEIKELETKLGDCRNRRNDMSAWVKENPRQTEQQKPESPDTSAIENQITEGAANQVRVEQYQKNVARSQEREDDKDKLSHIEEKQRILKKEKVSKLFKISEICGIKELSFDESGVFTYQGTQAGMLSGSQIERLSKELSALYPEGLGIDLLDRGESLGRSIFQYVDIADKKKATILATIVGEKPANIPERIGVYVVKDGIVFMDEEVRP